MGRKGERSVAVLGPDELYTLLDCTDFDVLLAKLRELGVHGHVSGYGDRRHVSVVDHQLPEATPRAREIAAASSTWVGKGRRVGGRDARFVEALTGSIG